MGIFRNKKNKDPYYESERLPDEAPTNCPRCGSRIEAFNAVKFDDRSPAPIEEGWSMAGVVPESRMQVQVNGLWKHHPVPAKCIIVQHEGDFENAEYVCLGLADRGEVEEFLAEDFPRGVVPDSVTDKPPCGWHGLKSDYKIKWI